MNLKDIARECGVSQMTVSRALRSDPKVSASLKKTIQQTAARLGYRPNPFVSALMSHRRAGKPLDYNLKLGFITNFPTRNGWRKFRLYREFYEGAATGADRHGYGVEEFWLAEPGMTPERLKGILLARSIPGLIFAPLPVSEGRLELDCEHFAAVAIGFSLVHPTLHRVSNYQFRSMRLLLAQLSDLGYQRPGLALPKSLDDRVLHQWLGAFLVDQPAARKTPLPLFVVPDEKWNNEGFDSWLQRSRADAVISQTDEVLGWLRASGHSVPHDIGFAHLDCPDLEGPTSGICQNGHEIGVAAADMLIGVLQRNERGVPVLPRTMLIEGAWVEGATTRAQVGGNKSNRSISRAT